MPLPAYTIDPAFMARTAKLRRSGSGQSRK